MIDFTNRNRVLRINELKIGLRVRSAVAAAIERFGRLICW
jgi:hypothetical protein